MKNQKKQQTFNDGVVSIYKVANTAADGDMPKDGIVLKYSKTRFHKRTVGIQRYWTAMQNQVQIDKLLRIPQIGDIYPGYVAIINGDTTKQYTVKQIQEPEDIYPPSYDISLERLEQTYGIK